MRQVQRVSKRGRRETQTTLTSVQKNIKPSSAVRACVANVLGVRCASALPCAARLTGQRRRAGANHDAVPHLRGDARGWLGALGRTPIRPSGCGHAPLLLVALHSSTGSAVRRGWLRHRERDGLLSWQSEHAHDLSLVREERPASPAKSVSWAPRYSAADAHKPASASASASAPHAHGWRAIKQAKLPARDGAALASIPPRCASLAQAVTALAQQHGASVLLSHAQPQACSGSAAADAHKGQCVLWHSSRPLPRG